MLSLVTLEDKLLRIWGVALVGHATTITSSNNRSDGPRSPRCDSIPVTNATRNDQWLGFFLSQRHHIFKAMFRDVEIVAVGIGAAGLGIGAAIGAWLRQLVRIDLFHSVDDLLAALHFETKMVQTVRRVLLIIGQNRQIEVAVGQKNCPAFLLALV